MLLYRYILKHFRLRLHINYLKIIASSLEGFRSKVCKVFVQGMQFEFELLPPHGLAEYRMLYGAITVRGAKIP